MPESKFLTFKMLCELFKNLISFAIVVLTRFCPNITSPKKLKRSKIFSVFFTLVIVTPLKKRKEKHCKSKFQALHLMTYLFLTRSTEGNTAQPFVRPTILACF